MDYKIGVNLSVITTQYELPNLDDIFASFQGGVKCSKLDFRETCNQVPVDEETSKLLLINMHGGLFAYNILSFVGSSTFPENNERDPPGNLWNICQLRSCPGDWEDQRRAPSECTKRFSKSQAVWTETEGREV